MRTTKDGELLMDEYLVELRNKFNDKIYDGFCMYEGVKIIRAFISNPCGYNKVFLETDDGRKLEHGIDPEKLLAPNMIEK